MKRRNTKWNDKWLFSGFLLAWGLHELSGYPLSGVSPGGLPSRWMEGEEGATFQQAQILT